MANLPLPSGERAGERGLNSGLTPLPLSQPSPQRGEG